MKDIFNMTEEELEQEWKSRIEPHMTPPTRHVISPGMEEVMQREYWKSQLQIPTVVYIELGEEKN